MDPELIRDVAVAALEDIKGRDIEIFDVRELTSLFDWVVIAAADSSRQTRALARHVCDEAREQGASRVLIEGEDSGEWILVDLGSVIVHVMQPTTREFYNLAELWGGRSLPVRNPSPGRGLPLRRNDHMLGSASL